MAVKIRLKRMGKIRAPYYRVVVMDSRTKRDGRAIEEIGKYHPTQAPSLIDISSDRAQYWLEQGAQPTEAVAALLKKTGDWQKFKGEPGAEGTLQVKAPATPKKDLYEAALAAAGKTLDAKGDGSSARRRPARAAAHDTGGAAAAEPPAAEAAAVPPAAEAPVAEAPASEAPAAEARASEAASDAATSEPATGEQPEAEA